MKYLHKTISDNIKCSAHVLHSYQYATHIDKDNAVGFTETDKYKLAIVLEDSSLHILIDPSNNIWKIFNTQKAIISGINGTINVFPVANDGLYSPGTIISLIANAPDNGYEFDTWVGDISFLTDPNNMTTTLTMPDETINISAQYTLIDYIVSITSGTGSGTFNIGDIVPITATIPSGYVFNGWSGDTQYITDVNDSTTTLTMPAGNVNISATFVVSEYTLSVINGTGDGLYAPGTVVNIVATPPVNNEFTSWSGDTQNVTNISASSTTITMPSANVTITAGYTVSKGTVTLINGSFADGGPSTRTSGTQVQVIPDSAPSGKSFFGWGGSGINYLNFPGGIVGFTYILTWPPENVTLQAIYI